MAVQDQHPVDFNGIIARVKAILLTPAAEWAKIEAEPASIGGLYTGYILILAAIRPVCEAVGGLVFGYNLLLVHYRPSFFGALSQAIAGYVLSLIVVFVLALVIDALAPSFGGQRDRIQALKVAAYSWTAAWVAGVFTLVPALSFLGLAGLYSLYLLYLGLPILMKVPAEKALGYTAVSIFAAIALYLVAGLIVFRAVGFGGIASISSSDLGGGSGGRIEFGNGNSVDVGKLQNAAGQLGSLAKQIQQAANGPNGQAVTPVSSDALKALLPEALPGGYSRTERESGAVLGTVVHAEATYRNADKSMKVSVTDLAGAGAFAAMAAAFGVESDRETATGFEKVGRVGGVMTIQEYDRKAQSGKYGVLLDDRFILMAEGNVGAYDDLKNAVATVGPDRVLKLR
jgi:hypothetical protein